MPSQKPATQFVSNLVRMLATMKLSGPYKREKYLEKDVSHAIRRFTKEALCIDDRSLEKIVFSHGFDKRGKNLWAGSKVHQNVVVYGCENTSDIFIKHPQAGSIYIELKLSKLRGENSTSLPGDLQRAIGQSVIASLAHPHVICLIVVQGNIRSKLRDQAGKLRRVLLENHRIQLVVRNATKKN